MIRKIYLVHHTHMDIGYTDQPESVMYQHLTFLDNAVALAKKYPTFCWTIESAYMLKEYLRCRRPEDCKALLDLLREGRFEVGAFEMQPLTELMTAKELDESVKYAVELGKKENFPVETALLDDVGGYAPGLPSAFAASGVKYLTAGIGAFQIFMPWADLPHLFYWRDAAGKRILIWNLGIDRTATPWSATELAAVYGMGAAYIVLPYLKHFQLAADRQVEVEGVRKQVEEDSAPDKKFKEFIARLERENYPYEEIMLQYGGDNRWPSDFLVELLEKINAEGTLPEIELTTPGKFFRFMEEKYGDVIPERSGALCDPWISRIIPSPEPLRDFLHAQRNCQYLENLGETIPEDVKELSALYSDHTCGLSEWHAPDLTTDAGANDAVFENLRASWKAKRRYADNFDSKSQSLLFGALNRRKKGMLTLFNCADEAQSGMTQVTLGRDLAPLTGLALPDGRKLNFQKIAHQRYWVEIPEIPAKSVLPLNVEVDEIPEYFILQPEQLSEMPKTMETVLGTFCIDKKTGAITKLTRKDGVELCGEPSLFAVHYRTPVDYKLEWIQAGMRPIENWNDPAPEITRCGLVTANELGWIIEQRGTFGAALNYRMRISIYRNQPFIDAECFFEKPANRDLQSVYFACHLQGKAKDWQIGQHTAILRPEKELLPGAMQDFFYAPLGAKFTGNGYNAYMQSFDAPVINPGSPQLWTWSTDRDFKDENAAFYWNIYHNLQVSDSPAWQPILITFRFRLYLDDADKFHPVADSIIIC